MSLPTIAKEVRELIDALNTLLPSGTPDSIKDTVLQVTMQQMQVLEAEARTAKEAILAYLKTNEVPEHPVASGDGK